MRFSRFSDERRFSSMERNERKLCRYLGISEFTEFDNYEKSSCQERIWKNHRYWIKVYIDEYERKMIWELYAGLHIPEANRRICEDYLDDCRQRTDDIYLRLDRYGDVKAVGAFDIAKCVWSDRDFEELEDSLFEELDGRINMIQHLLK